MTHEDWLVDNTGLRELGSVRNIWFVEPTAYAVKMCSGGCSAIAIECAEGALVGWSPLMLGAGRDIDHHALPGLLWSVLDTSTWAARLNTGRQTLTSIACQQPLLNLTSQLTTVHGAAWVGHKLKHVELITGDEEHYVIELDSDTLPLKIWPRLEGCIDWQFDGVVQPKVLAVPEWLNPRSAIRVETPEGVFSSAVFDGWPLGWRRTFVRLLGLPADTPVNSQAGLPTNAATHPLMSEWICRAIACRLAAWPMLRRRLQMMSIPTRLPEVLPEHLSRWWFAWRGDGVAKNVATA